MKVKILLFIFLQLIISLSLYSEGPCQEMGQTSFKDYEDEFISLIEMVYGEGLLSQGGVESINEMFQGIDLDGLKVLDLGSGLGVYDIYLAKHHQVELIGIDPQEKLVERANSNLRKAEKDLKGSVSFLLMRNTNNLNQFPNDYFDIIFSKESILHVPNEVKEGYFKEIYRTLKPGGKIVIMDWLRSGPTYQENTKKMMEMDGIPYNLLTPIEYQEVLKNAGFKNIKFSDITSQHAQLTQQNIDKIISLENKIKSQFGEDTYNYSLESWGYQRDAFRSRDLLTGILKAEKK